MLLLRSRICSEQEMIVVLFGSSLDMNRTATHAALLVRRLRSIRPARRQARRERLRRHRFHQQRRNGLDRPGLVARSRNNERTLKS